MNLTIAHKLLLPVVAGLCTATCTSSSANEAEGQPESRCIVSGYVHPSRISSQNPADYSFLDKPTRIYCFGISPDADGSWYVDLVREQRHNIIRAAMRPTQEAFLVLGGGATAGNMHVMGTDAVKRAAYAKAMVEYAHARNFDGIDIDWETDWSVNPPKHIDKNDMIDLLTRIRAHMAALPKTSKVKTLTAALSSNIWGREMGGHIKDLVDQINVMVYDCYGTAAEGYPHAPMRILMESLAGYAANGVPNGKIIVGVPFYGANKSVTPEVSQNYATLVAMAQGAITASSNSYNGYAFNGVDLMIEKANYVLDNGYAGITIWELCHDVGYDNPLSLLRAIKSVTDKK